MGERRDGPGLTEAELTPAATLTPETVRDVRERARRRDGKGWEYCTVPVEVVYALCDAADELARERRRVTAMRTAIEALDELLDFVIDDEECDNDLRALRDRVGTLVARALADAPGRGGEGEGR